MQIDYDPSQGRLHVSGALDIGAAEEFRKALQDSVNAAASTLLDLAEVDACDTAALQLLCAARKSAAASNRIFEIKRISAAIRETSAALGLPLAGLGANEDVAGGIQSN